MADSLPTSSVSPQVGVYECEITLKFRLLEESQVINSYGNDEFVETLDSQVDIVEVPAVEASPLMRRQLIRLSNRSRE
jgi:hypothetical protein